MKTRICLLTLSLLVALCHSNDVFAAYPERRVTFIVNSALGGLGDVISRVLGQRLSEKWGEPVIISNKSGAGGILSTNETLYQPADGYSIFITDASISTNPVLRKTPGVDPRVAFAPITEIASFDFKLVISSGLPIKSVKELIDYLNSSPGKYNYSSPGIGSPHYNIAQLFKYAAGVNAVHIPARGTPNAILDVATNRAIYTFGAFQTVAPLLAAGQIRALATTGSRRNVATPDLPTIGETLNGFSVGSFWVALVRPETPEAIRNKIAADFTAVIKEPAIQEKMHDLGLDPVGGTPAALSAFLDAEIKRWQAVPEGVIEKQ